PPYSSFLLTAPTPPQTSTLSLHDALPISTIAQSAPAASALARSPEYLMPPSAITGVFDFFASSTESRIAVICGTPTPATMRVVQDRKSTRLNSSHVAISYAVFCLKKKTHT